jgi:hypothetical protein
MKNVLTVLTLAASLFAASVQQSHGQAASLATYTIAASATSNAVFTGYAIDCRGQQNVAVEWTQTLAGAGSTVGGITFVPSIDGSTKATTPSLADGFTMVTAPNGATPVITITNFNVKGYSYLLLYAQTNGSANIQTNSVRYWVKRNAP